MSTKQQIQEIKDNVERTTQGLRAGLREFIYERNGAPVAPGTLYSIYYTTDKDEKFLTGVKDSSNSKIINKNIKSSFKAYHDLKFPTRDEYPVATKSTPTEADYRIGSITRYFTQVGNDSTQPVFEVTKDDYENQSNLYRYTRFSWKISGTREEVIRDNQRTIDRVMMNFPDISKSLFALELWKPPVNSPDDLEKKLSLLKKT